MSRSLNVCVVSGYLGRDPGVRVKREDALEDCGLTSDGVDLCPKCWDEFVKENTHA